MIKGTEKVLQLLESFDDVMLVTHAAGRNFDARPMHIAKTDIHCNVWFLSDNDDKVAELQNDQNASLIAVDKNNCWLVITGKIEIKTDAELIRSLWSEPFWNWFPQGSDSPGIRALQFNSAHAEYWDESGERKIDHFFKAVKAYVTGYTPEPEKKPHESVQL